MTLEAFIGIMIFIIGLVFGSFYNVVGYRLPNNMSIAFPSSHCTKCNHKLKPYELVPVISYLLLKGRCKKCKEKIGLFYPIFELITSILFLLSYLAFGLSIKFIISIVFISILIIITISDIKYYIIPDEVLIIGTVLLILIYAVNVITSDVSFIHGLLIPILNGLGSFAILLLFKAIGDFLFKKESLGGGDIKLLFVIGLVLGFDMSLITIFIASFIALPLSIISLIKNDNNVLAFGPYLSSAAVIVLLTNLDLNTVINLFVK